jgi:hypothetical protein
MFLLLLACSGAQSVDGPEVEALATAMPMTELPAKPEDGDPLSSDNVPVSVSSSPVRDLLLAKDVADLPDRAALDTHPDAAKDLADLATVDPQLIVRERALMLLALYPDAHIGVFCRKMLEDAEPKLRAGAVRCLAGQDLSSSKTQRQAIEMALLDADPRVGIAAAEVLSGAGLSQDKLKQAATATGVHAQTQERITELLEQ